MRKTTTTRRERRSCRVVLRGGMLATPSEPSGKQNEKDEKGKLCAGHLKRWYFFGDEVKSKFGADAEIYRCEHCKTLYLPNPEEEPRTGTLSY